MIINDKIEGFEQGYYYEIRVLKEEKDNVPADASKFTYKLVELVSKTPDILCVSWFYRCNNCIVRDGELEGCTRMFCEVKNQNALNLPRVFFSFSMLYNESMIFLIYD